MVLSLIAGLSACASQPAWHGTAYAPAAHGAAPRPEQLAAIGRLMFFDAALSASGRHACASCHDPRFAWGPPNALPVQLAGRDGRTPGVRAVPSLRYLQTLPPFSEHFFDNDGDDSIDAGPTGGHTWDGRASGAHAQARLPLLSAAEMANESPAEVVSRIQASSYAEAFRQTFGERIFSDTPAAFNAALMALEVFQQSPAEFYPYTSRYDDVLRGHAQLTEQQARGLALFNDESKGNCASCHLSSPKADGAFPLFTDFGLIAIGVPRNRGIPANADAQYFDMGLCGPLRTDFRSRDEYCGLFRTPTLRNVALKKSFFHNGAMQSLREVLQFYVRRDIEPGRFYPRTGDGKDGKVHKFDDLPARFHDNINTEPPFDRKPGDQPALSEQEIDDVIAFLETLTDADLLPNAARHGPQARFGRADCHVPSGHRPRWEPPCCETSPTPSGPC